MPTVLVAVEQRFPKEQRIVDDGLSYRMLPTGGKVFVRLLGLRRLRDWVIRKADKSDPGIWGGLLCRKRYIDEALVDASCSVEAVVNLGAGLDTRSFRVQALSDLPVWELDQQEIIAVREKRLREIFVKLPENVKLVAIDFDHQDLGKVLASHGYRLDKPTAFVWEGVTQYLAEQGVRKTFEFLAQAAIGSCLAFTYVRKDFLDGRAQYGWESGFKRFVTTNVWRFGMEPQAVPEFLREYGWRVMEDVGYEELATRYIAPAHRDFVTTPVERMLYAKKQER
jgi:methyltransferase (TIGR00027 family)